MVCIYILVCFLLSLDQQAMSRIFLLSWNFNSATSTLDKCSWCSSVDILPHALQSQQSIFRVVGFHYKDENGRDSVTLYEPDESDGGF